MDKGCLLLIISTILIQTYGIRLHKLFQYLEGYKSEHSLHGFLHIGVDYAVFIKRPKSHDKYLTYELYEAKNVPEKGKYSPRLLAVSKIPVDYLKDQLKTFRNELFTAKYVDNNTIPGTQVMTLREWQIEKALGLNKKGMIIKDKPMVLRTLL